jgi:hypothetical protein
MENLIPGFENFMEDTSVEVSVDVGDQEEVDTALATESEETAAEQAEVTEAVAEEEQDAAAAEMIFRRFDEIAHMKMVAEKYGVDRTFLALCNHNNKLGDQFRITLPSCESFDTVGDPRSAESQACVEGLGKVLSQVWEFIKKVCRKIKEFFVRLWDAIVTRLSGVNANIGRLRKALEERQDDDKAAAKAKEEVFTKAQLDKYDKEFIGKCKTKGKDVKPFDFTSLANDLSTEKKLKDFKAAVDIFAEAVDDLKKNKMKMKKVKLSLVKWSELDKMLDDASAARGIVEEEQAKMNNVEASADQGIKVAEAAATRGDTGADAKVGYLKDGVRQFNRFASAYGVYLGQTSWLATELVRTVGIRIRYGSKKRAGY